MLIAELSANRSGLFANEGQSARMEMSIVKAFSLAFAPRSIAIVQLTSLLYALVASKHGTVIVTSSSSATRSR
jgi:hypothetical protein